MEGVPTAMQSRSYGMHNSAFVDLFVIIDGEVRRHILFEISFSTVDDGESVATWVPL
jgi:hypothetical protein